MVADRTPPAGIAFRLLDERDSLDALTSLLHRAYAPLAAMGLDYVATHQSADVTGKRVASGECWIGILSGRIAATVTLVPPGRAKGAPWYERPGVAKIQQLAVEPELQGRGIGSALMALAEDRAHALGADEVALDTAEGAAHLIRRYEARGYRFVEFADWRPQTNYRSVILSLGLAHRVRRPAAEA